MKYHNATVFSACFLDICDDVRFFKGLAVLFPGDLSIVTQILSRGKELHRGQFDHLGPDTT